MKRKRKSDEKNVRRFTHKVHASVLFISLAQYANTSTQPPPEISDSAHSTMESGHSAMKARSQSRSLYLDQRLQALVLAEKNIAVKIVQTIIEVLVRSINALKKKTREREYDSQVSRVLKLEYVEDAS